MGLGEDVGRSGQVGVEVVPHGGGHLIRVGRVGSVGIGCTTWISCAKVDTDRDTIVVGDRVGIDCLFDEVDRAGRTGHCVG